MVIMFTVTFGEEILCDCESSDDWDRYAIVVINDGIVIGHFVS